MKQIVIFVLLSLVGQFLGAQKQEAFAFKEHKRLTATPVKNQQNTGTCWSFSTTSFLESEVIRMGKGEVDLSEMFTVRHIYRQKCENYVRRQGNAQFGQGGLAHDNLNVVRQYGVVPDKVYPGRKSADKPFNHTQLEKDLKKVCDAFSQMGKEGKLPLNWLNSIDSLLDIEFGKVPLTFEVNGTQFSPISYRDFLGLNADDYVNITSFTHHPFHTWFVLEIPDNFSNGQFYNLPLGEMMRCLEYSLGQGYTVEWDADVSNPGFSARNGIALVPQLEGKNEDDMAFAFKYWSPEKEVNQQYRQQMFDQQITMDDHLMHITGIMDESHSGHFYAVKNSWGEVSDYKGFVYVSEAYMRLNTISFTLHKNAIPSDLRVKILKPSADAVAPAIQMDKRSEPANVIQPGSIRSIKPRAANPRTMPTDRDVKPQEENN